MHREKETFGRAGTLDSTLGRFQTRRQATHRKCFAPFFYAFFFKSFSLKKKKIKKKGK
jgi:hypothetical protein